MIEERVGKSGEKGEEGRGGGGEGWALQHKLERAGREKGRREEKMGIQ